MGARLYMNKSNWITICLVVAATGVWHCAAEAAGIKKGKTSQGHKYGYSLVPPPPPTAVSPTVLAAYPHLGVASQTFIASKPRNLAEEMKLTAVMDDVAFFSAGAEGSIHLQKGKSFKTVTVAQISPEEVVLEEKGRQYIKRLK